MATLPKRNCDVARSFDEMIDASRLNELAQLPLLNSAIEETLRRYSPTTDLLRTLDSPFEFGGKQYPAGTAIAVNIHLINTDERIYNKAKQFIADRFVKEKPNPYASVSFGGGARRCLGDNFAKYEIRVIVYAWIKSMDLNYTASKAPKITRKNATLGPDNGVPMTIKRNALTN